MKLIYITLIFVIFFSCCTQKKIHKQLSNICYGVFDLESMTCKTKKLNNDTNKYFRYEIKNDTFLVDNYLKLKFIKNKKNNTYFGQSIDEKRYGKEVTNIILLKDKIITENFYKGFGLDTFAITIKNYTQKETIIVEFGDLIPTSPLNKDSLVLYHKLIDTHKHSLDSSVFNGHITKKTVIRYIQNKEDFFEEHIETIQNGKNKSKKVFPHRNLEVSFFDNFLYGIGHAIR